VVALSTDSPPAQFAPTPAAAHNRKAPGISLVLELLVPGAGSIYAKRAVTGVVWLLGTVVAAAIALFALNPVIPSLAQITANPLGSLTGQPLLLAALGVALMWLLLRCVLATAYVRAYNAKLERHPAPAFASSAREVDVTAGQRLKTLATVIVEMIPGGLGPYGIGDLVTALEAIAGRSIDGLKLTFFERLLYLGASAIPVVPARPFVSAYRWLARHNS
jgi:hypothetical protein